MGKIIIMIILVDIEITIIQTIIFEFENMLYLFNMSLRNWELWNFDLKIPQNGIQNNIQTCIQLFCPFYTK